MGWRPCAVHILCPRSLLFAVGAHVLSLLFDLEPLCSSCGELEGHSLLNFPARGGHPWSWVAVQNEHGLIIGTSANELRLLTDMCQVHGCSCARTSCHFPISLKSNTFCCISLLEVLLFPFSVCVRAGGKEVSQ